MFLSKEKILGALPALSLPWQLEAVEEIGSTNTRLKELGREGLPECFALTADRQTAGRGRLGRSFLSPAGSGIYLSLLLRPRLPAACCTDFTVAAAVCVCRAIQRVCGLSPDIKWVNDLMVGGKKLCGILTEAATDPATGLADFVVVGMGINVGRLDTQGDKALAAIVTSLEEETGKVIAREPLIAAIITEFDRYYARREELHPALLEEYRRRMFLTGRQVTLSTDPEKRPHTVVGVSDDAGLVVTAPDGKTLTLQSGEVSVLPVK